MWSQGAAVHLFLLLLVLWPHASLGEAGSDRDDRPVEQLVSDVPGLMAAVGDASVDTVILASSTPVFQANASIVAPGAGPTALLIARNLTIRAEDDGQPACLDAGGSASSPRRVVTVVNGSFLRMQGVWITGGYTTGNGGGVLVEQGEHAAS